MKKRTHNPFRPTYHRNGEVTVWNIYMQTWERTFRPSDEVLASHPRDERERICRHCGIAYDAD